MYDWFLTLNILLGDIFVNTSYSVKRSNACFCMHPRESDIWPLLLIVIQAGGVVLFSPASLEMLEAGMWLNHEN